MNSSSLRVPGDDEVPHPAVSVSLVINISVCFFLGLGNVRVLIHLYNRPHLRHVSHYLFANLSTTGFLALSTVVPTFIVSILRMHILGLRKSAASDLIWNIVGTMSLGFNILNAETLSLMAIDREDCVLRPFRRRLSLANITKSNSYDMDLCNRPGSASSCCRASKAICVESLNLCAKRGHFPLEALRVLDANFSFCRYDSDHNNHLRSCLETSSILYRTVHEHFATNEQEKRVSNYKANLLYMRCFCWGLASSLVIGRRSARCSLGYQSSRNDSIVFCCDVKFQLFFKPFL